jgi:steroid delta-isomerase-like uncharacterized protein
MSAHDTSIADAAEQATGSEAPSIEWIRGFSARWLDAWNSHRPDRILELLTEDVEVRDDSWPKTIHGQSEAREFLEALWRAVPDMTFELLDGPYTIAGEPRASLHWRGTGTFTGPMDPPGFAPTGRRWEIDGADFYEYRDGRICKLRVACDMMNVSRQLGLMPAAGSRGEWAMAVVQRGIMRVQEEFRRGRSAGA